MFRAAERDSGVIIAPHVLKSPNTSDYQTTERKFRISRKMLAGCLDLRFPVSVLGRLPLVLRDLDLLEGINVRARVVM